MTRLAVAAAVAALGLAASGGTAVAAPSSAASCVGTITSFEASQLAPGSVGEEVSGLASARPGLGRDVVSPLAQTHAGTIPGCVSPG